MPDMTKQEVELERQKAVSAVLDAAREFVRKCEAGEARSTRSYAAFKSALIAFDHANQTMINILADEIIDEILAEERAVQS